MTGWREARTVSPWLLLPLARMGLGLRLLLWPNLSAHALGSPTSGSHPVLRLLGARQLVQAGLDLRFRSPRAGTVNVATDTAHGLSCVALAAASPQRRTPALRDAIVAAALAVGGWSQRSAAKQREHASGRCPS